VGFDRYEGQRATQTLNAAYDLLRLWVNFFQPSMKLVEKHRVGSKVSGGSTGLDRRRAVVKC